MPKLFHLAKNNTQWLKKHKNKKQEFYEKKGNYYNRNYIKIGKKLWGEKYPHFHKVTTKFPFEIGKK